MKSRALEARAKKICDFLSVLCNTHTCFVNFYSSFPRLVLNRCYSKVPSLRYRRFVGNKRYRRSRSASLQQVHITKAPKMSTVPIARAGERLFWGVPNSKRSGYRERQWREREKIGLSQSVFVKVLLFTAHFDQKPIYQRFSGPSLRYTRFGA